MKNSTPLSFRASVSFLVFFTTLMIPGTYKPALAQQPSPFVRLARIEVDSTQLEHYKIALREGIKEAIRLEPGVLTLYAVSDKNNPTRITVLEVYTDADAYRTHVKTPHFLAYKSATQNMVKSLELIDVNPVFLGAKSKQKDQNE